MLHRSAPLVHAVKSAAAFTTLFVCIGVSPAAAQVASGNAQQKAGRFDELQQLEIDQRLRANPDVPPGQRLLIDYGGLATFDYLSLDDSRHNNHGLRTYELVGYARINLDGAQELFFRGSTQYRDYNPGDSFDGYGSRLINPDLDRGYYRFDLRRFNQARGRAGDGPNLVVQGGRDLNYWGNGLVLAEVLDGGRIDIGNDHLNLQAIVGITPTRTVDIDTSRPAFDHNTRRLFWGGLLSTAIGKQRPYAYALVQRDENDFNESAIGPVTTRYSYNSFYLGLGATGDLTDRLHYGVEAAFEGGDTLSNSFEFTSQAGLTPVPQTRNRIQASAADARLDYVLGDLRETRLSIEGIISSGDPARGASSSTFNGSRPGHRDNSFNAFGLLNTGLAFSPQVSNLMVLRLGASTFPLAKSGPFQRLQAGADFFLFGKTLSRAPIDEPTGADRFLGVEPDVYINWQIASDVTLALRYGAFIPNRGNVAVNDVRQFIFAGVTFAF